MYNADMQVAKREEAGHFVLLNLSPYPFVDCRNADPNVVTIHSSLVWDGVLGIVYIMVNFEEVQQY